MRTKANLPAIIKHLSKTYNLQIFSDLTESNLETVVDFDEKLPLDRILNLVSEVYLKTIFKIDGATIFRDIRWPRNLALDTPKINIVKINPCDISEKNYYNFSSETYDLDCISSAINIIRELSKKSQVNLLFPDECSGRSLIVNLTKATPERVIHGIAFLLNCTPSISLRKSQAQKDFEEDAKSNLPNDLAIQARKSALLRDKLLEQLSPDQKAKLAQGKPVELDLSKLPGNLRPGVLDYIQFSASTVGVNLNLSGVAPLGVRLLPPSMSPLGILGGFGVNSNGDLCFF